MLKVFVWIVVFLVIVRLLHRFLTGPRRHAAVRNALLAKITLPTLDESASRLIDERAKAIYAGRGKAASASPSRVLEINLDHMSEFERYSLYSLAMMELNVQPPIPEPWGPPPRNPFMMRITDHSVAVEAYYFKRHYGIETTLPSPSR